MAESKGGTSKAAATTTSAGETTTAPPDNPTQRIAQPVLATDDPAQGEALEHPLLEEGQRKGYLGEVADPTPNEAYTVAGVTKGAS
jgi:hypothetical protein